MSAVLIVHPHADTRGGTATLLRQLVRGLDDAGMEAVLAVSHDGALARDFREQGRAVHVVPHGRLRRPSAVWHTVRALARVVVAHNASVVFSNGGREHVYGALAALLTGRPEVWCQHIPWPDKGLLPLLLSRIPTRAVVANSRYTLTTLPARLQTRAHLIRFGVPIREVDAVSAEQVAALLEQEAITRPVITCVGGFAPNKGQRYLVEAAEAVHKRQPSATVLFAGSPFEQADKHVATSVSYFEGLQQQVAQRRLGSAVRFLGFRADVNVLLAASDVFVHPSVVPESFGYVIAEAMAAGVPVVASAIGAQRELVQDGVTGLLVPPANADAIAEAVLRIVDDPACGQRLGRAGRTYAAQHLNAERMRAELIGLFASLAGPPHSGPHVENNRAA